MWEARQKTAWQNFRHELAQAWRQGRADKRYIGRDFSRLILGGYRSRDGFVRALAPFRPRTPGFSASAEARALRDQLLGPGFTAPLPFLTADQVAEIRDYFLRMPYSDPYRLHLGEFRYPETPSPESNQGYYDTHVILKAPYLLDLFNHPLVLETAELILGCKPLLENLTTWWAFAGRTQAKGVQRFHRDFDTPRFIKIFLYLTDVDERSGAHVFVRGSQRSDALRLTRYIDDDEVEAAYGRDAVVPMSGPAGTCFLEDTYGIHKAGLPIDRPRLLVSAQYNFWRSPYAPGKPIMASPNPRYDPWINKAYLA
jgi:hypothetical protein